MPNMLVAASWIILLTPNPVSSLNSYMQTKLFATSHPSIILFTVNSIWLGNVAEMEMGFVQRKR